MLRHWSQFVPNMSTDIRGHEALHHHHRVTHNVERASCGVHKLLRTLAGAPRPQHLLVWWWRSGFLVFEGRTARDELFIGTRPLPPPTPPSLIDRMWSLNVKPKQIRGQGAAARGWRFGFTPCGTGCCGEARDLNHRERKHRGLVNRCRCIQIGSREGKGP